MKRRDEELQSVAHQESPDQFFPPDQDSLFTFGDPDTAADAIKATLAERDRERMSEAPTASGVTSSYQDQAPEFNPFTKKSKVAMCKAEFTVLDSLKISVKTKTYKLFKEDDIFGADCRILEDNHLNSLYNYHGRYPDDDVDTDEEHVEKKQKSLL